MNNLIDALKHLKVNTNSLACLGCCHEHSCGTRGCAIIRAAVEELEKYQWVSVKDHPPKDGEQCLVYAYDNVFGYWGRFTDKWKDGGWVISGEHRADRTVTHWMPLHKPPKEKPDEKEN